MDNRISTAQKMQMGGNRMATGMRMGTAAKQANFSGVGQNTKINVVERPMTNHGVGVALKTGASGPGR